MAELAYRKPKLLGHWSLENATDGVSPEQSDGAPLRLGAGASIYRGSDSSCIPDIDPDCTYVPPPLVGDGHLLLDGESGYAAADGPVVDTGDSFTLGVVVRLADSEPAHPMTVLSQAGEHHRRLRGALRPVHVHLATGDAGEGRGRSPREGGVPDRGRGRRRGPRPSPRRGLRRRHRHDQALRRRLHQRPGDRELSPTAGTAPVPSRSAGPGPVTAGASTCTATWTRHRPTPAR
ncbi:hypothetical protein ACRAWF_25025 [Streptomyces sp. L7]